MDAEDGVGTTKGREIDWTEDGVTECCVEGGNESRTDEADTGLLRSTVGIVGD